MLLDSVAAGLRRWHDRWLLLLIAAVYVALAACSALTNRPWTDEGHLGSASYNLAVHGYLGTAAASEENGSGLQGISRHTYWIMPLTMVNQAGWYKLFGFGLFSLRSLSIFYGLVLLLSCWVLARKLTGRRLSAVIVVSVLATDYIVISAGSMARPDMMCAGLGLAAWATYLWLREKRIGAALLLAHALVTASGLSHPNGLLYFAGLLFLMIWFDRKRLSWRHLAIVAVPYIVGGIGWGLYVLQSPADFAAQFLDNARNQGRLSFLASPMTSIAREITDRYMQGFGLGTHEPGHTGPIYLKSLILLAYLSGLAGALFIPSVRRRQGAGVLLTLFGLVSLVLTVVDGLKYTLYLVHTIPLLAMLLSLTLSWMLDDHAAAKWLAAAALAGLIVLQAGGVLLRAHQNTYAQRYAPAARFLQASCPEPQLIMGSVQLWFDLGGDRLLDDPYLGYFSHRQPGCIVVDDVYGIAFNDIKRQNPVAMQHIQRTLDSYRVIYDHAGFRIYRRF